MRIPIYLDYAATTPVHPAVERVMRPLLSNTFGNPNSIHSFGQAAQGVVDEARAKIAEAVSADFREIIFAGSATEANNLVMRGVFLEMKRRGMRMDRPRIIISEIEHESILEACRMLSAEGVEIIHLPVDKEGRVKIETLAQALTADTVLVSIMFANNEIGTLEPVQEIFQVVHRFREVRRSFFPLFHTDAVQALQFLDCNVAMLGADFMTLSAHKIYGPKGIGALYAKNYAKGPNRGIFLSPLIAGGGQEFGLRSGTQNVPAIAGFAKAVELICKDRAREAKRIAALRQKLWQGIKKFVPQAQINGVQDVKDVSRALPNILNVYFPGQNAQDLLIKLDLAGVAVSAGSACGSRMLKSSHVVRALGCEGEQAKSNLRFSLGRPTSEKEIIEATRRMRAVFTR